jgi:hypothetical protein
MVSMNPYRVAPPRPEPYSPFITAMLAVLAMAILPVAFAFGCTKQQSTDVITNLAPTVQCVAQQVLQNGVTDPAQIAVACSITAVADVIALVEALLAGAGAPDGGTPSLSAPAIVKLQLVVTKGHALLHKNE